MASSSGHEKKLVLIVEDEVLVAMEMEHRVVANGYAVLGPASTVCQAEELLDRTKPDGALLDMNLGGAMATPVARRLKEAGVPFAWVTSYARLPVDDPHLVVAPKLSKPVNDAALAAMLQELIEA